MLNMRPFFDMPYCVIYKIGGTFLSLLPGTQAPAADSERSAIYWEVDKIEEAYQRLIELGASPYLEIKTLFNIKIAQVIDPFGNTIGLTSDVKDAKSSINRRKLL